MTRYDDIDGWNKKFMMFMIEDNDKNVDKGQNRWHLDLWRWEEDEKIKVPTKFWQEVDRKAE